MTYFLRVPPSYGQYPHLGEHKLFNAYITEYNSLVMWGTIGKTDCCGSAFISGISLNASSICTFFQRVAVSVVLIECDDFMKQDQLIGLEKEVNNKLNGIGNIKCHVIDDSSVVILFSILDEDAYSEWHQGG